MAVNTRNSIVTNGLVLHLDAANTLSYQSGSTTWNDLSGNKNNGTLINGPTFDSTNGGSIVFDGVNDYIECTSIKPNYLTLNAWFKSTGPDSRNDSSGGVLISSSPQLFGGALQYALSYSWLNQRIVGTVQGNGGAIVTPDNTILRNQIYNTTLTYDGLTRNLYVNGVLISSSPYSTNPIYPTTGNINTQIGRWGYASFTRNFKGDIYQTSIYNRALSPQEILQNYNATKSRFNLL